MLSQSTDASKDGTGKEVREMAKAHFGGIVPNQIKRINEHSPAAAKAYIATMRRAEQGELPNHEREVVILAVSRYNDCHYCTRTHAYQGREAGLSQATIEAIHRGGLPADEGKVSLRVLALEAGERGAEVLKLLGALRRPMPTQ